MAAASSTLMSRFSPVTEADLARARSDPAYRQRLLQQSLDVLLGWLQKQHQTQRSTPETDEQIREGVSLAVRLAELIQSSAGPARGA
jgi:hypothetical protein